MSVKCEVCGGPADGTCSGKHLCGGCLVELSNRLAMGRVVGNPRLLPFTAPDEEAYGELDELHGKLLGLTVDNRRLRHELDQHRSALAVCAWCGRRLGTRGDGPAALQLLMRSHALDCESNPMVARLRALQAGTAP